MPVTYKCPNCGSEVVVGKDVAEVLGPFEQIGCNNTEKHNENKTLVMWEKE